MGQTERISTVEAGTAASGNGASEIGSGVAGGYGHADPHPLSQIHTELVWEGKYDEFGNRRTVDAAGLAMPMQRIETIDEPRARLEAQGDLFDSQKSHLDDFRNFLIWGDNLLVLSSLLRDLKGKVDLVYLDPPFDVGADFTMDLPIGDARDTVGKDQSALELVAYRDTWGRGRDSYLHMIYERLVLMRDLLSERGTIYLHCDWRVAGALRLVLDDVFGTTNFLNEVIWQSGVGDTSAKNRKFIKSHDTILAYKKGDSYIWNDVFQEYGEASDKLYRYEDDGGSYRLAPVDNPGGGGYVYDLGLGERMPANGYRMPKETALQWLEDGVLKVDKGKVPSRRQYRSEQGVRCRDVWTDISGSVSKVYATQKPDALLERIIHASSDPDSIVADLFCGSGTTGVVAERMGRRWIMGDLGRFAIHTSRKRLIELQRELHAKDKPYRAFDVLNLGRYERQWWQQERLKGADEEHRRIVLEFFKAEILANPPSPLLHGRKGTAFCHVDAIDSIFTREEAKSVAQAAADAGAKQIYCLSWEFEMDVRLECNRLEKELGAEIKLIQIPREIMEKNRKEPPPFLEVATLTAEPVFKKEEGRKTVDIKLTSFIPSLSEIPTKELETLRERAMKSGFDFIDFWAVDFEFRNGEPFHHDWQDYRLRKDRSLKTTSEQRHAYDKPGTYTACVKVVDIFGSDTSITVEVVCD